MFGKSAQSNDSDQPAHLRRLILVIAKQTCGFVGMLWPGPNNVILKTVGEVAETLSVLYHFHETNFQSK